MTGPNRRSFLRALLALPIAATLDVEQLLWIPGQLIVVPAGVPRCPVTYAEIARVVQEVYAPDKLRSLFMRNDPLLGYITDQICIENRESREFVVMPLPTALKDRPVSFLVRDRPRIVIPTPEMQGELPIWTSPNGPCAYGSFADSPDTDRFFAGD